MTPARRQVLGRDGCEGVVAVPCPTCQGNGEVVTDWGRYLHARDGDVGDEAVAECSACSGTGTLAASEAENARLRAGSEA